MSAANPPTKADRTPMKRQRGRLTRPSASLIAQGEPMVWFTGGALVVCATMITGLLGLVLWNGLPTFWPGPLIRVQRLNGQVVMGEVTREETFRVTADMLGNLEGEERQAAEAQLKTRGPYRESRRLFRTGNYELTNEHYRWVNAFDVTAKGEELPNWGVVVERVEWGRFYGEPVRFSQRVPRDPGEHEQQLLTVSQFLDSQKYRLSGDEAAAFDQAIAPLTRQLAETRSSEIQRFVQEHTARAGQQESAGKGDGLELVLEGGEAIRPADLQSGQVVSAIREVWSKAETAWEQFARRHASVRERFKQRHYLEMGAIGAVNQRMEQARLRLRAQELQHGVLAVDLAVQIKQAESALRALDASLQDATHAVEILRRQFSNDKPLLAFADRFVVALRAEVAEQKQEPQRSLEQLRAKLQPLPEPVREEVARFVAVQLQGDEETVVLQREVTRLNDLNACSEWTLVTASGQEKGLSLADIVRAYPANQLTWSGKTRVYLSRWHEFLTDEPREANSEGGVFPAIWGTVVMTLVMSLLVVPFGVLAALYLREYARAGLIVSAIRISISNLAGVPSIVFGVFGLGFFCYVLGSFVDGGAKNAGYDPLPPRVWWLTLVVLAVAGVIGFVCGLAGLTKRPAEMTASQRWFTRVSWVAWAFCSGLTVVLIFGSPYFGGFNAAALPNPTFGKGGLLWASLTLALLTLPVVIVATEEALSAVPNSLREGSYACGASKWQTIRRIVLPHAMPGIMTGMILAMARGAGEAAPLMLVGAVKLAPDLPIDSSFPFVHFDRSFMHLGFHIFDVGFQSPNSEAAKPMVFTTTLMLILIIALLNLSAIWIRSKLRRRFLGTQF